MRGGLKLDEVKSNKTKKIKVIFIDKKKGFQKKRKELN
jgi:hypothetical protein